MEQRIVKKCPNQNAKCGINMQCETSWAYFKTTQDNSDKTINMYALRIRLKTSAIEFGGKENLAADLSKFKFDVEMVSLNFFE